VCYWTAENGAKTGLGIIGRVGCVVFPVGLKIVLECHLNTKFLNSSFATVEHDFRVKS